MDYHVLIADDEPEIRSILRELVEANVQMALHGNYTVIEAKDGQEAIEHAVKLKDSGQSLDMAVIDLRMPGKDGFQTIDELIKILPLTPIIAFSATTSFYLDRLRGYGGRVTPMEKPVLLATFAEAAVRILSRSSGDAQRP